MWWLENTGENGRHSQWKARCPQSPSKASKGVRRQIPARRAEIRFSDAARRTRFARLDLTPDQHAANALLLESVSSDQTEHDQLRQDVRQLECLVRRLQSQRDGEAAELVRLRQECDRWLAETMELSQQLSVVDQQKDQLTRDYETTRAELSVVRSELERERLASQNQTINEVEHADAEPATSTSTALIIRPKAA